MCILVVDLVLWPLSVTWWREFALLCWSSRVSGHFQDLIDGGFTVASTTIWFFSLLPPELVIKGKCLMPWAQSAYTTQLPWAMLYYQVSSTFLFCWLPSDWWHLNITSITLMPAETEDSSHTSAKGKSSYFLATQYSYRAFTVYCMWFYSHHLLYLYTNI